MNVKDTLIGMALGCLVSALVLGAGGLILSPPAPTSDPAKDNRLPAVPLPEDTDIGMKLLVRVGHRVLYRDGSGTVKDGYVHEKAGDYLFVHPISPERLHELRLTHPASIAEGDWILTSQVKQIIPVHRQPSPPETPRTPNTGSPTGSPTGSKEIGKKEE